MDHKLYVAFSIMWVVMTCIAIRARWASADYLIVGFIVLFFVYVFYFMDRWY